MTITAEQVRSLIVAHDAARPRSQQTRLGPSDLSSPCARKIGYGLLQVPAVVPNDVSLYAYVGTGLHRQLEDACKAAGPRWSTEKRVSVPINDTVTVTGHLDAYDHDTKTVIDWKSRGANKPSQATRDKHHQQLGWYGLGAILAGLVVDHLAIVYIPRNGTLADIEVDARPVDMPAIEAQIRRYESLLAATAAGPAVLPMLPTEHDCKFCSWWAPGHEDLATGCPGEPPTSTTDLPPWEPNANAQAEAPIKEKAQAQ